MKIIMCIATLVFFCSLKAQEKPLTVPEAEAFLETAEERDMIVYYEGEELYDMYAKRERGEIMISGNEIYKAYGVENVNVQNCDILLVNTTKLTAKEKTALKQNIFSDYKAGILFTDLIAKYGEGEHSGATDYDVVIENTTLGEAFAGHTPGEILTVEYEGGFYVIVLNGLPVPHKAVRVLHATYKS
jgi:hypothetical protein